MCISFLQKEMHVGNHQIYIIQLTDEERKLLKENTKSGQWQAREVRRAQVLLLADIHNPDAMKDADIGKQVGCSLQAVQALRKRFAKTQSIEDTIFDHPRSGRPTIVDGAVEAHVTKIACSAPPKGHARWSLKLIRDRVVTLDVIDDISSSTIGRALKKKSSNPG